MTTARSTLGKSRVQGNVFSLRCLLDTQVIITKLGGRGPGWRYQEIFQGTSISRSHLKTGSLRRGNKGALNHFLTHRSNPKSSQWEADEVVLVPETLLSNCPGGRENLSRWDYHTISRNSKFSGLRKIKHIIKSQCSYLLFQFFPYQLTEKTSIQSSIYFHKHLKTCCSCMKAPCLQLLTLICQPHWIKEHLAD